MSSDTLRTALVGPIHRWFCSAHYGKQPRVGWPCERGADVILQDPTGKALADVVAKTEAFAAAQRQWLIDGHIGLVHEGYELMTAIDRLRKATR